MKEEVAYFNYGQQMIKIKKIKDFYSSEKLPISSNFQCFSSTLVRARV